MKRVDLRLAPIPKGRKTVWKLVQFVDGVEHGEATFSGRKATKTQPAVGARAEARKQLALAIGRALDEGFTVHAASYDQTGAVSEADYHPDGRMTNVVHTTVSEGFLGPRCFELPWSTAERRKRAARLRGVVEVEAKRKRKTKPPAKPKAKAAKPKTKPAAKPKAKPKAKPVAAKPATRKTMKAKTPPKAKTPAPSPKAKSKTPPPRAKTPPRPRTKTPAPPVRAKSKTPPPRAKTPLPRARTPAPRAKTPPPAAPPGMDPEVAALLAGMQQMTAAIQGA